MCCRITIYSSNKKVRPDGWQCRWDAPSQTLVTIYLILNFPSKLFNHLSGCSGTIGIGGHHDVQTVKGLIAGHARQVDILYTSYLLVCIDVFNRSGN